MSWLCPQELHLMPVSPFVQTVPTQLGMLIDSAQVSAKEGAGEGLTEQSRLGPVGGLWASCAEPAVPHSLILEFYRVTEGVSYLVPMCPRPSEPKKSLGLHVSPFRWRCDLRAWLFFFELT